ncbi:pyocin activator PrtN family protein [Azotobacter chroococcum]|nr:pyocin activator PrtN family protein [Azotobacter chroococcum]
MKALSCWSLSSTNWALDLPIVRMAGSQKAGRSMHLTDMARYLDAQHQKATAENDKPHDRAIRKAG